MFQGKILRVARPTDRLDRVVRFYTDGLGLQILDRFENHEGFDGCRYGHCRHLNVPVEGKWLPCVLFVSAFDRAECQKDYADLVYTAAW